MPEAYVGLVDVGFLRAEGGKKIGVSVSEVRTDAAAVAGWLRNLSVHQNGQSFLRAYWYDGAFETQHREYHGQRRFFDAIAATPGIQLRLGHIAERPARYESGIRSALRTTAVNLGLDTDQLLQEFDRHWTFHREREQKGVDTLIALDMVRLASRAVCSTIVLISGDRDLAEAVRTAQDFGIRVLVATPRRESVAKEVAQLADDIVEIDTGDLQRMLPARPQNRPTNPPV